jgi:hypothetical protein
MSNICTGTSCLCSISPCQSLQEYYLLLSGKLLPFFPFSSLQRFHSNTSPNPELESWLQQISGNHPAPRTQATMPTSKSFCIKRANANDVAFCTDQDIFCAICHDEYKVDDDVVAFPCCRLYTHLSCLLGWVEVISRKHPFCFSCPQCREPFNRRYLLTTLETVYRDRRRRATETEALLQIEQLLMEVTTLL